MLERRCHYIKTSWLVSMWTRSFFVCYIHYKGKGVEGIPFRVRRHLHIETTPVSITGWSWLLWRLGWNRCNGLRSKQWMGTCWPPSQKECQVLSLLCGAVSGPDFHSSYQTCGELLHTSLHRPRRRPVSSGSGHVCPACCRSSSIRVGYVVK